jgi:hypothetical protein
VHLTGEREIQGDLRPSVKGGTGDFAQRAEERCSGNLLTFT